MHSLVVYLAILAHVSGQVTNQCPEGVTCISTLKRNSCPDGTYYREGVLSRNCCPGCVRLKETGEPCRSDSDCAPGLNCDRIWSECKNDREQSCEYYKREDNIWKESKYWQPDCLANGKYAPKQCKGDIAHGKCFCVNEKGNRIFGERSWENSQNMTCACSRLVYDLARLKKPVSLHCDDNGNFEELQCDDHVCWCSNERTGKPYTPVVPESMIAVLPCYDPKTFGSQYLRQCDSVLVNSMRARELLKFHGTLNVPLPIKNCNYDGSYARMQRRGKGYFCMYKNAKKLTEPSDRSTDCNCVYDRFVTETIEKNKFNFFCNDEGTYMNEQYQGDSKILVDPDGFPYSFTQIQNSNSRNDTSIFKSSQPYRE